jgi:hypothetical protein
MTDRAKLYKAFPRSPSLILEMVLASGRFDEQGL